MVWQWKIFIKKSCRKYGAKTKPKTKLYFGITKNNGYMQEFILKKRYYGRGYQKALKVLTLISLVKSVPLSRQSYQKWKRPVITSHSSGHKTSSQNFLC